MSQKYQKIASHEAQKHECQKVLLLYSGGLDTSVLLKWIQEEYDAELYTLTIDLGPMSEKLPEIKAKALKLGAKKAIVIDAKDEFADEYLSQAIKANADYQGDYYLSCPIGRALIAKIAVQIAQQEKIKVIAHGSTGKGNDQVRFESYLTTLDDSLKVIAPVREWSMGRDEQIEYAKKHKIPILHSIDLPYSHDDNMWGNTNEGGEIEQPSLVPPLDKILQFCKEPEDAPDKSETLKLKFQKGVPTHLNGKKLSLKDLILKLNDIGAKHGVGITHLIEDRLVGLKVRGVYEQPAAEIIVKSHKDLEKLVSTREENAFKTIVDSKWAYLCYGAQWMEPLMDNLNAFIDQMNEKVTGEVTVKLYKGKCTIVALTSPYSLFNENLATFMKNDSFNQNASPGFIEIFNLSQKTAHQVKMKNKK